MTNVLIMKKLLLIIAGIFIMFAVAKGQNDLTPEQIASMKVEGINCIQSFQSRLSLMVKKDPSNPEDLKDRIRTCELCKGLFYANGGKYYRNTQYGRRLDTCTIETIRSFRNQTKKIDIVAEYLDKMARTRLNLVIDSCSTVRIDNPYKQHDGSYLCTAHFYQVYVRYSSDGMNIIYIDETHKTAILIIEVIPLPDKTVEFYVRIEDIKADECRPYSGYRR